MMNESAAPIPRDDPVGWRALAAPLCALGLAWLFWAGFAPANWGIYGPGLGIFVLVAAHFAAVLLMLGRRVCWSQGAALLMGASLVLALCAALYSLPSLALCNCFVILATAAMATFALSGQCRYGPGRLIAVFDTIRLTLLALCSEINAPFRLLRQVGKARWGRIGRGVLAVVIALPVVGLVIWLLSSADPVFRKPCGHSSEMERRAAGYENSPHRNFGPVYRLRPVLPPKARERLSSRSRPGAG